VVVAVLVEVLVEVEVEEVVVVVSGEELELSITIGVVVTTSFVVSTSNVVVCNSIVLVVSSWVVSFLVGLAEADCFCVDFVDVDLTSSFCVQRKFNLCAYNLNYFFCRQLGRRDGS